MGGAGAAQEFYSPARAAAPISPLASPMADTDLGLADSCITYQLHLLGAYIFFGDLTPTADTAHNDSLVRQLC